MLRRLAFLIVLVLASAACGDDGTATSTSATESSGASSSSSSADTIVVQVFFLDEAAFEVGRSPLVVPVERSVAAASPEAGALDALFAGPSDAEAADGLRFVASESTGYTLLRIDGGTAHVQLTGGCSSGGSTFSVADEIGPTLRQFDSVDVVKIYDPEGETGAPDDPGDSIPFCLEP